MIHLASQSSRRRELLAQLGVAFQVLEVNVPEVPASGEDARAYVQRVAVAKARAGWAALEPSGSSAIVLGADTEVVRAGRIFGKPRDDADAAGMLRELSGRTHRVISVVCCVTVTGEHVAVCESRVAMAELDETSIARYVATGEPRGKAGGYAIQGRAAAFIRHLSGSYSGVMGLPLYETAGLLRAAAAWP